MAEIQLAEIFIIFEKERNKERKKERHSVSRSLKILVFNTYNPLNFNEESNRLYKYLQNIYKTKYKKIKNKYDEM